MTRQKLPIGIQDFRKIREGDYVYVDKTEYIYHLIQQGSYYFLSRPRHFGKSLLISTLRYVFEGQRDLFKGLWIESRHDWQASPVIPIAFKSIGYVDLGLPAAIDRRLEEIAQENGLMLKEKGNALRFQELIKSLSVNGMVVVLINEYDKPIIDYLEDLDQARQNRDILKKIYSILKEADPYLRLIFITGVSKFSKVSIFSDLNNLEDITISRPYSAIAGYTEKELNSYFTPWVEALSAEREISTDALHREIKEWYNGYNWTGKERIYNPFSILNYFKSGQFRNYWFATGTPTFLIKLLHDGWQYRLDDLEVSATLLDTLQIENPDFRSLLFQTGYLTIKNELAFNVYTLDYPNLEVKDSLSQHLLGAFSFKSGLDSAPSVLRLKKALDKNDLALFFKLLDQLYANIPERVFRGKIEASYHAVLYTALSILAVYIRCEVAVGEDYADALIETDTHVYLMEFKIAKTADQGLKQIRQRRYAAAFQADERQVIGVGVAFSPDSKGVADWKEETFKKYASGSFFLS
jgi:hypothetical protein